MMSSLNRARPHAAVVIAYLGLRLNTYLKAPRCRTQRLPPNYFKTLGEGPVRKRMPIASIDPLTSQSTAFEHNRSATESAQPLSLVSPPPSLYMYLSGVKSNFTLVCLGCI